MRQKVIRAIQVHAQEQYPRECCGAIAQRGRVERYFPCRNIADAPQEHFVLAPEDYARVEDWGTVTGIVLSVTRCCYPGIFSAGRKAIFVPFIREENCRCWNVRSCLAIMIAGDW